MILFLKTSNILTTTYLYYTMYLHYARNAFKNLVPIVVSTLLDV